MNMYYKKGINKTGLFDTVWVAHDQAMFNEIRNYIRQIEPEKEKIVKFYRGSVPTFRFP